MKVYFACSISGGREFAHLYTDIVESIKRNKLDLLSELFADQSVAGDKLVSAKPNMSKAEIWEWDLNWVKEADLIIAEVTQPSLGVGYELAKAEEWDKPILCLFYEPSGKRLSGMIEGSPKIQTSYYSDKNEVEKIITDFVNLNR